MNPIPQNKTLLGYIEYWSTQSQNKAFINLPSRGEEYVCYDYEEFYGKICNVASYLSEHFKPGERMLLLASKNEQFMLSFLGCMLAGLVPVPCNCPREGAKQWSRLAAIIEDADVSAILGENDYLDKMFVWIKSQSFYQGHIKKIPFEGLVKSKNTIEKPWLDLAGHESDIAFIQYTSGSTGSPKGVMVTHDNLVKNMELIRQSFCLGQDSVSVSWLPLFHDMGLISVLSVLYSGGSNVLMLPINFIRHPLKWLEVATEFKATHLGGPNFAYEHLLTNLSDQDIGHIDLSTVKTMFNGSEPISATVVEEFVTAFKKYGLNEDVYRPCYGMAEVTLLATISDIGLRYVEKTNDGRIKVLDKAKLGAHVSCGSTDQWVQCRIVDPNTFEICKEGQEGEIWLSDDSISPGYWNKGDVNELTFGVELKGCQQRRYLRTGDLGFVHDKQLYVTNRIKDVIIIRGRNYYAQDIERAAAISHDGLHFGGVYAFAINSEHGELLTVLCEVSNKDLKSFNLQNVSRLIKREVAETFEINVEQVLFVTQRSLPKTSSGKKQRSLAKQMFCDNNLQFIKFDKDQAPHTPTITPTIEDNDFRTLIEVIANTLKIEVTQINCNCSLIELGMDSLKAALLSREIENVFGVEVNSYDLISCDDVVALNSFIQSIENKGNTQSLIPTVKNALYEPFELTDMQQAYFVGSKEMYNHGGHSLHTYLEIDGDIDIGRFIDSWSEIIKRHPIMRAQLTSDSKQQILSDAQDFHPIVNDFSDLSLEIRNAQLSEIRDQMANQSFELTKWPFFDIRFSILSNALTRLHLSIDGIFLDFRSFQLLFNQVIQRYQGKVSHFQQPPLQFSDYLSFLEGVKRSAQYAESIDFWKEKIRSLPAAPKLPLTSQKKATSGHRIERKQLHLSIDQLNNIDRFSKQFEVTKAAIMLAAFSEVISRWSENKHFTLNVPLFNRPTGRNDFNATLGNFSSFLLIESDHSEPSNFITRAKAIQEEMHRCLRHSQVSGIEVVRLLTRETGQVLENGFPVVFTHLPSGIEEWDVGLLSDIEDNLGIINYNITRTPQVWLDNQIWYTSKGITINWDSVAHLFPDRLVDDMFSVYRDILFALANSEDSWTTTESLYQIPCTDPAKTDCDFIDASLLPAQSVLQKIVDNVNTHPEKAAIVFEEKETTYQELLQSALTLSAELSRLDALEGNEPIVAIAIAKSDLQVVSALGILFAGGAYVPIDTSLPHSRIQYMLENCQCNTVITTKADTTSLYDELGCKTVFVEDLLAGGLARFASPVFPQDEKLAMVIYTSGTTGKPKAVMVEHGNLNHLVASTNLLWEINNTDACLAVTNLFHDLATYDIFGLLAAGGKIVMPTPEQRRDPSQWHSLMNTHGVTFFNSVPSAFEMYLSYLKGCQQGPSKHLRTVALAGDWISIDLVRELQSHSADISLICSGGPTETTVFNIWHKISKPASDYEKIPYGKPYPNNHYTIVDANGRECPLYVVGEMVCSGVHVSRGYLNNPQASLQSFFVSEEDNQSRCYRTGDMGYKSSDGNVYIVGRKDNQVKIHGYRIELDEIEFTVERELPFIDRCIAKVIGENNNRTLVLFYALNQAGSNDQNQRRLLETKDANIIEKNPDSQTVMEIKRSISNHLPVQMVPKRYFEVDAFPLTQNGKVDRSKLLVSDVQKEVNVQIVSKVSDTEQKLLSLWRTELGNNDINIDDNFFAVGGDSVKLVNLHAKIASSFSVEIKLVDLFGLFCVRDLAAFIDQCPKSE
ncbi:non-ribosomal peptide synthetase [Grimontia marina]|uniref:Polyketide synthase PksJ n=1 Tax=Grimontia marina TaxID=646534 RepID=A0A128FBW3_9GAMM|nr:non-ribosomal peptide synthetase [Grimontia marina]CZF83761.1 Polyketide synthase PksJ [Grimontia marina]